MRTRVVPAYRMPADGASQAMRPTVEPTLVASPAEQRAAEPLRTGIGMREALPVEGCDVTPTCSTIGLLNVNNK